MLYDVSQKTGPIFVLTPTTLIISKSLSKQHLVALLLLCQKY